ncbi:MAG: hypothetical protein KGZ25_01655 [Planctomycetes bacterium]|nr:hypothetical protein [Planctomycetota bacterium]
MAKKKTSSSKKDTALHAARFGLLRIVLPLGIVTLIGLGTSLGIRSAASALNKRPEFALSPSTMTFQSRPPCVRKIEMLQELRDKLRTVTEGSTIFDKQLCYRAQQKLREAPWVVDVKRVQRVLPNRLSLNLVFRKPAGIVEINDKRYLVDPDGYWLPKRLYRPPEAWKQHTPPVIIHKGLTQHPPSDRAWNGTALAVGARLTQLLGKNSIVAQMPLKHIDVTDVGTYDSKPDIIIQTLNGPPIKWGTLEAYQQIDGLTLPESEKYRDPPDDQKIAMLKKTLAEYPQLKNLKYIDLRFNKLVTVAPSDN